MADEDPYEIAGEVDYSEGGQWTRSDDDIVFEPGDVLPKLELLECGCEAPCTCDPPGNTTSSSGDVPDDCACDPCKCDPPLEEFDGPCVCDPCDCDPPLEDFDGPCVCDPCECDPPLEEFDGPCVCDPCDCDPPLSESSDEDGPCVCDPCECDPPVNKDGPCVCDPCECDPPPVDKDGPCVCDPCECVVPVEECTCDPCECEPPEIRDCVTPPIDLFDAPFLAKLQGNLRDNQRKTCFELRRQKPITKLTEDIVLDLMLKDNRGKAIVYLPGNQIHSILRYDLSI